MNIPGRKIEDAILSYYCNLEYKETYSSSELKTMCYFRVEVAGGQLYAIAIQNKSELWCASETKVFWNSEKSVTCEDQHIEREALSC